jgi:hypothetical protein
MLERKFHDHLYSGSMQLKLIDLTSVRQGRERLSLPTLKGLKKLKTIVLICQSLIWQRFMKVFVVLINRLPR